MDKERKKMNAVHVRDLDSLLGRLGMLEDFSAGNLKCKFCKQAVTHENIYSVLPDSGTYHLIDDKVECVSAMLEYIDEKSKAKPIE